MRVEDKFPRGRRLLLSGMLRSRDRDSLPDGGFAGQQLCAAGERSLYPWLIVS